MRQVGGPERTARALDNPGLDGYIVNVVRLEADRGFLFQQTILLPVAGEDIGTHQSAAVLEGGLE